MNNIKLMPYNPKWADVFECDKETLQKHLHKYKNVKIHHVGSTSMPTVEKAKPVIDILVEMDNYQDIKSAGSQMYSDGFRKEHDCNRLSFELRMGIYNNDNKDLLVNMIHFDTVNPFKLNDLLLFKRYILEHPDEAQKYFKLKENLVKKSTKHYDYTHNKWDFVDIVNRKAARLYTAGKQNKDK